MVGKGGLRFLLTYSPEKTNSAYVQFFIDVDDESKIDALLPKIEVDLAERPEQVMASERFAANRSPHSMHRQRQPIVTSRVSVIRCG